MAEKIQVVIMGAAGRDFHNFNVYFRDNPKYEVVAFTQAAVQNIGELISCGSIEGKKYPKELAGKLYPKGIPIYPESDLVKLIKENGINLVVFAYHDMSYRYVMNKGAIVNAAGADFMLMGPESTMLKSKKPVIAVCAVRTGCGKSETSRAVARILKNKGYKVVVVRHPMPYGDLVKQTWQRFASFEDLDKYECTIEEREDYEPHIAMGTIVYAGVDYEKILRKAEKEADIIIWDGGNNDFSFYKPDLYIVLADALRPGHELRYYAGEINAQLADVVIVNKEKTAKLKNIKMVKENIKRINPGAIIIDATSPITVDKPELIKGKRALVVEDGPTLTHGGMAFGAGTIAAKRFNCKIIDPRKYSVGSLKDIFKEYKQLGNVLPAMGYSERQIKELEKTINNAECDVVISGTPIDLRRVIKTNKEVVRVRYELKEIGEPNLETIIKDFLQKKGI